MKSKQKDTSLLRRVLTASVVLCFVFFLLVFIQQYLQYKRIEDRLTAAYSTSYKQSAGTYKLLSTYGEVDNLFRLYTIDYDARAYDAYKIKLDTLRLLIDSIAHIPLENNPMSSVSDDLSLSQSYASEFAQLRKNIDDLIFYAVDSLVELRTTTPSRHIRTNLQPNADSIVNKILQDSTLITEVKDTVVREKRGLLNRIFKARNDTLVNTSQHETLSQKQIDVVHKNIEHYIETTDRVYRQDLSGLRRVMLQMRNKERALITVNYGLLMGLKRGLDRIKELEIRAIRENEARDFALYKNNFDRFGLQLVAAVIIMLFMLIFIVYYYYKTSSFETKLYLEKEYASKIAEEKTNLLANVSHEVRAPVNSLKGIIDLLRKDNNVKAIDQEIIQSVDKDISIINSSLNDILSISKLEADELEIKKEYFSPFHLLEEVVSLHQYTAKTKKLTYSFTNQIDPNIAIYSNSFRMRQVISNLISNAIKYTEEGKVTIHAAIDVLDDQHKLVVTVRDTGIGIAPEKKDQVFRKYYVADNKSRSGGFGLGLYISKLLSEQIGGDLSFISKFEQGSTFTFELPIDRKHLRRENIRNYSVDDIPHHLEVVIIDDSRISLFFIQQLFKGRTNVHLFHSAINAWSYIQNTKVDVVITDLIMPEMDGWELLNNIKSSTHMANVRVLVSTAEPMLLENTSEKKYHFDGFISKPVQENEIVKAIIGE